MKTKKSAVPKPKLKKDGTPSRRGEGGGAPKGSRNREKFKEEEERKALFAAYIAHLEGGKDQKSFSLCDWETVERYAKTYPDIFKADDIKNAKAKGHAVIEALLFSVAMGKTTIHNGKVLTGNAAAAIFLAKNKIGYRDRVEVSSDPKSPFNVRIVDDIG